MAETLLPCPFCGGDAVVHGGKIFASDAQRYFVRCGQCSAGKLTSSEDRARETWNRRATPPGDKTLREALTRGNGARGRIIGALHEHSPGTIEEGTDLGALAEDIIGSLVADGLIAIDRAALPSAPEAPG